RPTALTWLIDGAVTPAVTPEALATMPPVEAMNRCHLVTEAARAAPIAPIVAWLDDVARDAQSGLQPYVWRDVVLTIGSDPDQARRLRAFRSASLTAPLTMVAEADLPFLEVVCQHVAGTLEMAALYATLEQRVEERTLALSDSNAQLADSLERLRS